MLTVEPIWPWSALVAFLSGTTPAVLAAALTAGIIVLGLPIVLHVRPGGVTRHGALRAAGTALGVLAAWILLTGGGPSGGLFARFYALGMVGLLLVPFALAGLTIWTYLGVPGATSRRITFILICRLLAFALAILAVLRPALALPEKDKDRQTLFVAMDASESMSIKDEIDNRSRWEQLLRTVQDARHTLDRIREDVQTDIVFFRFADDVSDMSLDEPGKPDGKRTDIGQMLKKLYESRDRAGGRLRGLLVLSDGADNGTRFPAVTEATRWRGLPCPVHVFAYGKPTTADRQSDIIVSGVQVDPSPARVKGEMTVRTLVDAPGFENRQVRARLFINDKEVAARDETLRLTRGNEVKIKTMAPATPGEIKLTVRIEDPRREGKALPGELSEANNEIGSYVTVAREGISVLLVDKQRAFEPQLLCDALRQDPRINLHVVWLRGDDAGSGVQNDLFQFDRQQYDVVILGDVTARQLRAVNRGALAAMDKLVSEKGSGLVMIGGYSNFGNSDWQGTEMDRLLPVALTPTRPVETPTKMVPTEAGLRRYSYVLRLGDTTQETTQAWEKLRDLEGYTPLGAPKPAISSVLATTLHNDPLLVTQNYGNGRTLAFAGDTTWRWARNPETRALHSRFWRQMVIWLARQEEAEGNVWVKPDTRRLPARADLGFSVGLRSKGGVDLKNGSYRVEVIAPGGARSEVATSPTSSDQRGTFARTDAPGEYRIIVHGEGKDAEGNEVKGEATARFLVYDEDLETTRRAADHEFLRKIASAGNGEFHRGDELGRFLESIKPPELKGKTHRVKIPNWRTDVRDARGKPPSMFLIGFFLAFVAVLSTEWLARRHWGLA